MKTWNYCHVQPHRTFRVKCFMQVLHPSGFNRTTCCSSGAVVLTSTSAKYGLSIGLSNVGWCIFHTGRFPTAGPEVAEPDQYRFVFLLVAWGPCPSIRRLPSSPLRKNNPGLLFFLKSCFLNPTYFCIGCLSNRRLS